MLTSKHKEYFMRINPISQNNQSFKAVNQKYYKRAVKEINCIGNVTIDWLSCLRYDIALWKEIPARDGIDTLLAVKKLISRRNDGIAEDMKFYKNMLKEEQSNQ